MDETRTTGGQGSGSSSGGLGSPDPTETTVTGGTSTGAPYGGLGSPDTAETTSTGTGATGTTYGSPETSSFGSTATQPTGETGGREWIGQLQGMIDNLATQAAPVVREIAAKAAELAAAAGEKAGPIAHKAADVTEAAGHKLAERGRVVASDLRRGEGAEGQGAAAGDIPNTIQPGAGQSTAGTGLSGTESTYPGDTSRTVGE